MKWALIMAGCWAVNGLFWTIRETIVHPERLRD